MTRRPPVYHLTRINPIDGFRQTLCGAKLGGRTNARITPDREDVTCPKCRKAFGSDPGKDLGHAAKELDRLEYLNGLGRGRYSVSVDRETLRLYRWLLKREGRRTATWIALQKGDRVSVVHRKLLEMLNAGIARKSAAGFVAIDGYLS